MLRRADTIDVAQNVDDFLHQERFLEFASAFPLDELNKLSLLFDNVIALALLLQVVVLFDFGQEYLDLGFGGQGRLLAVHRMEWIIVIE